MSKKTKTTTVPKKSPLLPYPKEADLRVGCKVSWHYYHSRAAAEECAKAARHNAFYLAGQGYDYGYCCPGTVEYKTEGPHAGFYEVCVP
jgi:hypothetical protein